ncbi:MAG TPA: phosphoglycerate dehydrogenase [Gaiellales bacterium]|nr:phosphoglycerate dehydrogenase [Gaiellales bacterium]
MLSVLVKEEIAQAGVDLLRERFHVDVDLDMPADRLPDRIGDYDALIVRSATRVSAELLERGRRLKVIGRAGTGVDNVDVAAATRRGIIVANAPGSNMVAAAEHAVGLLLAIARNIPQAHAALVQGRWERRRYGGVELADKTLAVIGFGRIGQLVAARARALEMRVVVYDPFVSAERCRELQVTPGSLENVLLQADFVTLHAPLTDETRHLLNADRIALMKPGVRIVNAARGDLIDLDALVAALRSGQVAGAGLDVFPEEPYTAGPILELENVVVTPHLGASTQEAQDRAGVIVAEQVAAALAGGFVANAVNVPHVGAEDLEVLGPYLPLATRLGRLAVGLHEGGLERIDVTCAGALARHDTRLITQAVLVGAFASRSAEPVNLVNARAVAESRGITVGEERTRTPGHYTNLVRVSCDGEPAVAGTTMGVEQRPWLAEVEGYQVEIELSDGHFLVMLNDDRPGMIGQVGLLFGEEGVNIANMSVSRSAPGERAVMVLAVDSAPDAGALERLRALDGIHRVRLVSAAEI